MTSEIETAKELIEKEAGERVQKCQQEMQSILDKYHCRIEVSVLIKPPNRIVPMVDIVARNDG